VNEQIFLHRFKRTPAQSRSNERSALRMLLHVNGELNLTTVIARWITSAFHLKQKRMFMVVYFAVFSALVISAGTLAAKIFEWRQDVLYGPYICRDRPQKSKV
jgi:hypothetical protein